VSPAASSGPAAPPEIPWKTTATQAAYTNVIAIGTSGLSGLSANSATMSPAKTAVSAAKTTYVATEKRMMSRAYASASAGSSPPSSCPTRLEEASPKPQPGRS